MNFIEFFYKDIKIEKFHSGFWNKNHFDELKKSQGRDWQTGKGNWDNFFIFAKHRNENLFFLLIAEIKQGSPVL